jgi:hypothetical protein
MARTKIPSPFIYTPLDNEFAPLLKAKLDDHDTVLDSLTGAAVSQILFGGAGSVPASSASLTWDDTGKIMAVTGGVNLTGVITKKGTGTPATLANLGMQSYDTVASGTLQDNVQNCSPGGSASSDMVCTADTGTDSINYVDMGINSSGYNDAAYTIGGALASYLLANGGDLTVGTATATKVLKLHTGGTLAANLRATVSDTALTLATGVALAGAGAITSSGGGIGYATGAGGTVTQGTSRTTGVTLNKFCGTITMFSAAQASQAAVTFTMTNSFIAATDYIDLQHIGATNGGCWNFSVVCAAGSVAITVLNVSAGSITEATPLLFVITKAVTA